MIIININVDLRKSNTIEQGNYCTIKGTKQEVSEEKILRRYAIIQVAVVLLVLLLMFVTLLYLEGKQVENAVVSYKVAHAILPFIEVEKNFICIDNA